MKIWKFRCWSEELRDYIYFVNGDYTSPSEEEPHRDYCKQLFDWYDAEQLDDLNNPIYTNNNEVFA